MTCDHDNATGIGSAEYRDVDGETYRVERWECDDCGDRHATVLKEVGRVEIDSPVTTMEIINSHRDAWSD